MPRELMFPDDQTREQTTLTNTVQMNTSQQGAVAVALGELGIDYEPVVLIAGIEQDAPAEGTLEAGDVVLTVDGRDAADVPEIGRASGRESVEGTGVAVA